MSRNKAKSDILQALRLGGSVTSRDLAVAADCSITMARKALAELVDLGMVICHPAADDSGPGRPRHLFEATDNRRAEVVEEAETADLFTDLVLPNGQTIRLYMDHITVTMSGDRLEIR